MTALRARNVAKTETNAGTTAAWLEQPHSHHPRSVAVEVGFEPTEDLRLHTLSSTAHHRSPPSGSVRDLRGQAAATGGERPRTGVNETKTETRAQTAGPATAPPTCRQ